MRTQDGKAVLIGDWRRRRGTKTDAHLWPSKRAPDWQQPTDRQQPMCGKAIPRYRTVIVQTGRPCTECLVMAITRRP